MILLEIQQFVEWKNKYWNLYYVEIADQEFLFREISRLEYRQGLRLYKDNPLALEEYICHLCVLEPEDYDFGDCLAGIPTTLANLILHESGFTEDTGKFAEYLEKYRKEMETLDNQMACVIKEAFPELSIEEIESWPMEKTIWYFTRAEYILSTLRGIELEYIYKGDDSQQDTAVTQAPSVPKAKPKEKPVDKPADNDKSEDKYKATQLDFQIEGGSIFDFPELAQIEAFMKGKPIPDIPIYDEELL